MKNNLYAVILAGGKGTRFWPVSRQSHPKQFLNITGKGTLLQETLNRIKPKIKGQHIFIVTNAAYRKEIARQVARFKMPMANILLEPSGKNTAPAICWAAAKIHQINPQAVMMVLPSDHLILNQRKFREILGSAVRLAQRDYLVTLGIVPTRPETGYGYLKTSKVNSDGKSVVLVDRFTEKPSLGKAKQFLRSKHYYWNSGMFIWRTGVILNEFKKHLPKVYRLIGTKAGNAHVRQVWPQLPSISIDYGILEKARNVAAVPAPGIEWSDLGSWESLTEILTTDKNGNIFKGDVVSVNSRHSFVWGDRKITALVGIENIIIIDTPDALLICRKDRSQDVRHVVSALMRKKRSEI